MKKFWLTAALLSASAVAHASQLFPTAGGTTWQYEATEETGGSSAPAHSSVKCRLAGIEQFKGRKLLKLETLSDDVRAKTELIAVDDKGLRCFARSDKKGPIMTLPSPEIIVPAKLKEGSAWESDSKIADIAVHQDWTVVDSEDISVAAGSFHAFRFHSEQSSPASIVSDRWFVPGTGFIKEIMTMRSPTGELLGRRTLELKEPPKVAATSEPGDAQKLLAGVSSQPSGKLETTFSSSTLNLYARWEGHGLRDHAKVRAVWIAENVGDIAPPNYKIDDATAIATTPDSRGIFTLSRPESGWAPGTYRVEFYLDETLIQTVRLRIE